MGEIRGPLSVLVARIWLPAYPHSRLCIRCRAQGFILPADDASQDTCRGHLAEDRVNNLIGYAHG